MIEIKCNLGHLSRPDGSVLFSEGETTVMAGVYGPIESKQHKSQMDRTVIEAHFRPRSGLPGVKDRLNESIIKGVCDAALSVALFPRTSIIVVIQEMQNSGQLLSCSLNATCLALLNSGIDMKCMFAAISCFLDTNDTLMLQPPNQPIASFMFVFDSVNKSVIASNTEGSFSVSQYKEALVLCRQQSSNVFDVLKKTVIK